MPHFEKILQLVMERSSKSLISPQTFDSIRSLAGTLPIEVTYGLGFETRLAQNSPEVDFILRPHFAHSWLVISNLQLENTIREPSSLRNWSRLRNLCSACLNPDSSLHEAASCLWIEFDAHNGGEIIPDPSIVFVQLKASRSGVKFYESIAAEIHLLVKGVHISDDLSKNILRRIDLMPKNGAITLLGLPIARPGNALRIVIGGLGPDQIPGYVSSVGWKGPIRVLESLIFGLGGYAEKYTINFDLDQSEIGKIGIEFGIPQEHVPSSDPRWEMILDFLVRQGWCRKDKRAALLNWPKPLTYFSETRPPFILKRFISHIKLSLGIDGQVEAKGYFGLIW